MAEISLHRSSSENVLNAHRDAQAMSLKPLLHSASTCSLKSAKLSPPPVAAELLTKGFMPSPGNQRHRYVASDFPCALPFPIHSLAAKGRLSELKASVQKNQEYFVRLEKPEEPDSACTTSSHSSAASSRSSISTLTSTPASASAMESTPSAAAFRISRDSTEELQSGFSIDIRNCHGMTALHGACYFGRIDVVKYLVKQGANVNSFSHFGLAPAAAAASDQTMLSKKDASYAGLQKFRVWATPLHFAASSGHKSVVSFLLAHGADERLLDYTDSTPAQVARLQNHKKTAALLDQASVSRYRESQEALVVGSGGTHAALHALGNASMAPPVTLVDLTRSETLSAPLKKESSRSMSRLFRRKSDKAVVPKESSRDGSDNNVDAKMPSAKKAEASREPYSRTALATAKSR